MSYSYMHMQLIRSLFQYFIVRKFRVVEIDFEKMAVYYPLRIALV